MKLLTTLTITTLITGFSHAATIAYLGGDFNAAASWDGGVKPTTGDIGTIAMDGFTTSGTWNFGGAVINQTAGTIDNGTTGFHILNSTTTWNLIGGTIKGGRYVLANGSGVTINASGGTILLENYSGTQYIGVANNGNMNISGTAVIDDQGFGTQAPPISGSQKIDIAENWSGSWKHEGTSLAIWKAHFTGNRMTYNGATIDGTTFDSTFQYSGKTLSLISPVPEPSSTVLLGLGGLALILRRRK